MNFIFKVVCRECGEHDDVIVETKADASYAVCPKCGAMMVLETNIKE